MAISYIGSASGTNTATMPTHAVGDLLVVFAYRDGSNTTPTLASGWTNIQGSGSNTNSARMGWKIAASTGETTGTWTNATSTIVAVYRGADGIGGSAITGGSSITLTFPAVTMQVTDGTSWVVGGVGHRSTNVAIETAPTGMTNRISVSDATDEAALHDTNGGVSSRSSTNASVGGTASGYRSITVELLNATAPTLTGQTVDIVSTTSGTPKVTTNKASGTLYMVCVPDGDTPSVAQIKAGQNSSSGAAINAQNRAVTATGVQTFTTVTGLTAATQYDFWFVHTNSIGDSSPVKADFIGKFVLVGTFATFSSVSAGGKYSWTNPNNAATSNNVRANCGEGSTWGATTSGVVESTDLLRSSAVSSWTGAGGSSPGGTVSSVKIVVEGYFNSPNTSETISELGAYKDSTATRLTMSPAVAVAGTSDITSEITFTGGTLTADDLNSANFYVDVKMQGLTANSTSSGANVAAFVDYMYVIVTCDDVTAPPFTQNNVTLFWAFP